MISLLEVIKEATTVLSKGHVSIHENYALVETARDLNIRVTVTHPLNRNYGARLTLRQQLELADKGAIMEHCFLDCIPPPHGGLEVTVLAEHIKSVGAEHCLLFTASWGGSEKLGSLIDIGT